MDLDRNALAAPDENFHLAVAENVDMRRLMVIREDGEPKPVLTKKRRNADNLSVGFFQLRRRSVSPA